MNKFEKVLVAIAVIGVGFYGSAFYVLKLLVDSIKKADENER